MTKLEEGLDAMQKVINKNLGIRRFKLVKDLPMLDKGAIFSGSDELKYTLENKQTFEKDDYIFDKIEITTNFFEEINETGESIEKEIEIFDLEAFGKEIQEITNKAIEGERSVLKTYILLKRIVDGVEFNIDKLKDLAYQSYVNNNFTPQDKIGYGYGAMITQRIKINFEEDFDYKKLKEQLKERESLLKNAVEQSRKNIMITDEQDGEVIQAPNYSFTSSLTLKKIL